MNSYYSFLFVIYFLGYSSGQGTTCSNNNLLMTPILREKVLNVLNVAREKLQTGQLILSNGKLALEADNLSPLEWDCEMEEELFEAMEDTCEAKAYFSDYLTSKYTWWQQRFNDENADTLVQAMLDGQTFLTGKNYLDLSRHNLYLEFSSSYPAYGYYPIIALSDKAQKVACAIQHCNVSDVFVGFETLNNIVCKVSLTQQLQFGDEIYPVSPSVFYTPPTSDVVCPNKYMTIEQREAILQKVNQVRSQTSLGAYPLQNGNSASQPAQPLLPLAWSCDDETAMNYESIATSCSSGAFFDAETEFQKVVTGTWMDLSANMDNFWTQMATEFFDLNSNFNFLFSAPNPPTYSTQYPAAFAFSDKAETLACYRYVCNNPYPANPNFHLICRIKPSLSINDNLYLI